MKVGELIYKLSQVDPDAEIIGGVWNGKADTYTFWMCSRSPRMTVFTRISMELPARSMTA